MNGFTLLKGKCPICNGARKDCRQSNETNLIFCHDSSANPTGYHFRGTDPHGFGMWQSAADADAFSDEAREERQREIEQRRIQWERERLEQIAHQLPADERDRHYRKIFSQLKLSEVDRQELRDRGFTDAEIKRDRFVSVESWQKIQGTFPANLPGLISDNTLNTQPGYLIPVRDADGRIVGAQFRLRDGESGRYRWLSSKTKRNPEGATPHLDGELPLALYRSSGEGVWLVEGTGAKPSLASKRLKASVIGAASGRFDKSPLALKQILAKLGSPRAIVVAPDAGDALNSDVMPRWRQQIDFLQSLGLEIKIAWWGQTAKSQPDIDELGNYGAIDFISPDEFFEISDRAQKKAERESLTAKAIQQLAAEEEIYERLTTIQEKPWKVVNQPLIDLESLNLEPGVAYIVSSAKGTGKTKGVVPLIPQYEGVLAWFNRVALGREECHKLGLTWKDDASTEHGRKRGFCADSAHQFSPAILGKNGLLLVDEADQVFSHTFGSTCNKDGKRPLILATLEAHLSSALHGGGNAIFMSADISQKEIDYIRAIAPPGFPVRVIVNEYQPPKGRVFFDISDKPDGQIEQLLLDLEAGKPCFVIDDIKNGVRGCKSIAEYVRSIHPEWVSEIEEINSDTSGDPAIVEYLKTINEGSMKTRLLCCSPSVVSGISIENGRFAQGVYGFANGILTVNEMSQALTRVRGASEVRLWVAEEGLAWTANRASDPREIRAWYKRNYRANAKHILSFGSEYDPMSQEWDSPHYFLFCKNAAYRNLCMGDLRSRMRAKLESEGWEIVSVEDEGSDMIERGLKESWSKIEIDYAESVAAAPLLTDEELEALQNSSKTPTPEEKFSLEKTYLLKSFGEEIIEATTFEHKESGRLLTGYAAMLLKNERGVYKQQLDNFYLLASEIGEAITKDLGDEKRQLQHGEGRFAGDIRWRSRQRKAREFLGLDKFLDPDRWWEPRDYEEMAAKAKAFAPMIKDALNLSVERIGSGQIFGELLRQIGLGLEKQWVTPEGGRRYKRRRIAAEDWRFAQMYVEFKSQVEEMVEPAETVEEAGDRPPLDLYESPVSQGGVIETVEPVVSTDVSQELEYSEFPAIADYAPGQEVWFYSPVTEQKWLKGKIHGIANGMVRVTRGAISRLIDRCEEICPGHWHFAGVEAIRT